MANGTMAAGDPWPWYGPYPYYPIYQTPTWTCPMPTPECKWFEDEGNKRFMFFTSCGAQIEYDQSWWKHCPKCGGVIIRPDSTQDVGE